MCEIIQTDRDIAEMIARFRTPPGFSWIDLANDIETVLKMRSRTAEVTSEMRQAGAAIISELSGVISSEGLAERVYRAMVPVEHATTQ